MSFVNKENLKNILINFISKNNNKLNDLKNDLIKGTFNSINTSSNIQIENSVSSFVSGEKIYGKTLKNYFNPTGVSASKVIISGDDCADGFVTSRLTINDVDGGRNILEEGCVYTFINLSNKSIGINIYDLDSSNTKMCWIFSNKPYSKIYDIDKELKPKEKFVYTVLNSTVYVSVSGYLDDGWEDTDSSKAEFKNSLLVLEGNWSDKEIPSRYFSGLESVGDIDPIEVKATNGEEESSENYKEYLQKIYASLRSVGDAKDELDIDRGVIIRRVGTYTVNGNNPVGYDYSTSADFSDSSSPSINNRKSTVRLWFPLLGILDINCKADKINRKAEDGSYVVKNIPCITDGFKYLGGHNYYYANDVETCAMQDMLNWQPNTRYIECYVSINKSRIGLDGTEDSSVALPKIQSYLNSNPVTFMYELETPYEERINDFPLRVDEDTKEISVSSNNIKPTVEMDYPTNLKQSEENNVEKINILAERPITSNPNLLINGDFRINQRGKNSYNRFDGDIYTIDRWATLRSNNSIELIDKGIKVTCNEVSAGICQPAELPKECTGQYVTVSFKLGKVTGTINANIRNNDWSKCFGYNIFTSADSNKILSYIAKLDDTFYQYYNIAFERLEEENTIFELEWVKLEFGDKATPFIPKSYTQELLDCKRYYQKILSLGTVYTSDVNLPITYPVEMRTIPTCTFYDGYYRSTDDKYKNKINVLGKGTSTVSNPTVALNNKDLTRIHGTITCDSNNSSLSSGQALVMFVLEAEIY